MGRKFVDGIWIRSRMNLSDARHEAAQRRRLPAILQAEAVPFASVEIIRVPAVLCPWCPGFDPTALANKGASHRICARCQARLMPVVDVQLVPVSDGPVVEVALVRKPEVSR